MTFQTASFFSVSSEFITLVKGTNYDLSPAPVGSSELRREIQLQWVRWSSLKAAGSSVTVAVPAWESHSSQRRGFCLSLPLALQYPPFLSINVSSHVPFGQGVWHNRCSPVQGFGFCPHPQPTIAQEPFHTLNFPFYTAGNRFLM